MFNKHQKNITQIPRIDNIQFFADKILEELPERYQPYLKNLAVKVENFADEKILKTLNILDKYDLLGLYQGIPIPTKTKKTTSFQNIIYLYRCPLVRYAYDHHEDIKRLVHHVLVHEIGHHFGFEDHSLSFSLT